jgi:hypothetical protein
MKSIVFTSIIGNSDALLVQPNNGDQFLAFLDVASAVQPWEIVQVERKLAWSRMESRRYKILSHLELPPHEYSLWIDGRVQMKEGFRIGDLVEQFLDDADIAMFAHHKRTCIYEEAWECRKLGLDDPKVIYDQIARYTRDGYPANNGLHEGSVILRRNSEQMQNFNQAWWEEMQIGSVRDQLSFDYLAYKHKISVAEFPGDLSSGNPYFVRHERQAAGRQAIERQAAERQAAERQGAARQAVERKRPGSIIHFALTSFAGVTEQNDQATNRELKKEVDEKELQQKDAAEKLQSNS